MEMLSLPFMQRAFISGIVLALVLAFLGVYVVLRKMAFSGAGIAHASLGSIAIGIVLSMNPIVFAVFFGVVLAIVMHTLEQNTKISSDAVVGIIFASGMSIGIIIISRMEGYQPELISYLFGSILAVSWTDLWIILIVSTISIIFMVLSYNSLTLLSLDKDIAAVNGVRVNALSLLFDIAVAISVIIGVKLLGVVLVSALLVVPPSISKIISASFKEFVINSILFSEAIVVVGLGISYYFDLPSGATIALLGGVVFGVVLFLKKCVTFLS